MGGGIPFSGIFGRERGELLPESRIIGILDTEVFGVKNGFAGGFQVQRIFFVVGYNTWDVNE